MGAYFPGFFGRRGLSPGPRGCGASQAMRPEDGGAGGSQRCRRGGMAAAAPEGSAWMPSGTLVEEIALKLDVVV